MTEQARRRVYELRVHGVSGTPPESILGEATPRQVAGDDAARFFRAAAPVTTLPHPERKLRSRTVEAFHWGRFTSGGASRALWLLLVPFALLNLSRYMLLGKGKISDVVLRLLGVVLTAILVANVVYMSLELVVRQCVSSDLCLQTNTWLDFTKDWTFGAVLLLGAAPVTLMIALLWWFGRQTFLHEPKGDMHAWSPKEGSLRDHAFWHTSPKAPVLRALHVAAACGVAGILYSGTLKGYASQRPPSEVWVGLLVAGGTLLLLTAVAVGAGPSAELKKDKNPKLDAVRVPWWWALLKWLSVLYFVVSVGVAAWLQWNVPDKTIMSTPLSGFEVVTMALCGLAAVLLIVLFALCLARRIWDHAKVMEAPRAFRPMWLGMAPFFIAAFATTLAAGFSGGFAYRVADLLGAPTGKPIDTSAVDMASDTAQWPIKLSAAYWTGVVLWGVLAAAFLVLLLPLAAALARQRTAGVLLLLGSIGAAAAFLLPDAPVWGLPLAGVALAAGIGVWTFCWRPTKLGVGLDDEYKRDTTNNSDEPVARGINKIAMAWRLARSKYRYHWVLGTLCALGGLLVIISGVVALYRMVDTARFGGDATELPVRLAEHPLGAVGGWVLSGIAAGLVLIGVESWQGQKMRTIVGVVWDLISFWPRYAHPICPPPYGGRAVLAVASRANYLVNGRDPSIQTGEEPVVVLSGHSQGSVVCAAAVLLLQKETTTEDNSGHCYIRCDDAKRTLKGLRLVTYGSQLQWAFARLFPRYLGYAELKEMRTHLDGRWRNVHRATDPLGGPVLVWRNDPAKILDLKAGWSSFHPADTLKPYQFDTGKETPELWAWKLGDEYRLRDPEFLGQSDRRPQSPLRGHSGYYLDPVFDEIVADLAEPPPGQTPSPERPFPPQRPDPPTYTGTTS